MEIPGKVRARMEQGFRPSVQGPFSVGARPFQRKMYLCSGTEDKPPGRAHITLHYTRWSAREQEKLCESCTSSIPGTSGDKWERRKRRTPKEAGPGLYTGQIRMPAKAGHKTTKRTSAWMHTGQWMLAYAQIKPTAAMPQDDHRAYRDTPGLVHPFCAGQGVKQGNSFHPRAIHCSCRSRPTGQTAASAKWPDRPESRKGNGL